ncbi:SDR family NAD(P)-dependent oxidoreductase [Streptosporangium carneum]|uniref:Dihydroanticapsin 7-dehydrogenase n=1 Tax=Streptosporangium carneum TaxID=47481 RepID=A0A9W6HZJ3_9ACTN|nr:SDR family oxidoreductase [Streptosporangium carneum]GLK08932.1 dihydroanticapsin 7-dehydrogenase [Streptosporangium carneum]
MDLGLSGRSVLVTGGASGIGRATVDAFLAEGAVVTVLDRARKPADLDVAWVQGDVTDEEAVRSAVPPRLDVAVGCAGISGPMGKNAREIDQADFARTVEVNLTGQFLLAKHAAPALAASTAPSIVFVASDSSFVAAPGMAAYCASKGGVLMLTKALAVDFQPDGIRVNCVCPSIVDTPMARGDLGDAFDELDCPVLRPEDVARSILYLASPASRGVNGTAQVLDFGGLATSTFPA